MPEIPDLEAIRHYLMPRFKALTVTEVETPLPWLVRTGAGDLETRGIASAKSIGWGSS